ncbi:hypothetical protein BH20CHL6_BH20CHL6_01380 [soil metagenome]
MRLRLTRTLLGFFVLVGSSMMGVSPAAATGAQAPTAGPEAPAAATASCSGAYAILYEDASYGGNSLRVCFGQNISDLRDQPTLNGCDGGIFIHPDWADCISSFKIINANCHHRFVPYVDIDYSQSFGSPYAGYGSRAFSTLGSYNDKMSSLRWTYVNTCPTSTES